LKSELASVKAWVEHTSRLGGKTIEGLRQAGSRGEAVHGMLLGLQRLALNLFRDRRLDGVLCLGGAEGAVLGASAMLSLPIGIPKIIVTPIASGRRRFGPLVGTRDVMVVHSVVDILGLNPISTTIFDNVAAAMAGMLHHGHRLRSDDGRPRVAITMLGNTTKAVMTIRDALARQGLDSVIFHSNGVGGPAMEELAADGLFVGVIDFTTDELADELVGGFHVGGPERLRRIGRLGLPQIVVPGCIDFTVHGRPEEVPVRLQGRPVYTHNPEFTLVRTLRLAGRADAKWLRALTRRVSWPGERIPALLSSLGAMTSVTGTAVVFRGVTGHAVVE